MAGKTKAGFSSSNPQAKVIPTINLEGEMCARGERNFAYVLNKYYFLIMTFLLGPYGLGKLLTMKQAGANTPAVTHIICQRRFQNVFVLLNTFWRFSAVLFCTHVTVKDHTSVFILGFMPGCPFSL